MSSGRVPASCPPGFQGRYTVRSGDTMFLIAQRFGVSLNALIAANPHISNPARIFPGDVLCVPGTQNCREPVSCPPGFQGRYTVQPGDTMFFIAQRYGVSLNALIAANPQISNPAQIFPCDVLCVPGKPSRPDVETPCVSMLRPPTGIITDASGSVLVRFLSTNQRSISVLGVGIPAPSSLGNYDSYQARVMFPPPEDASFELLLSATPTIPSQSTTWSGSLSFVVGSGWPTDTLVVILPINTNTGTTGAVVLSGTLSNCCN